MAWLLQKLCEVVRDCMLSLICNVMEWWTEIASINNNRIYDAFNGSYSEGMFGLANQQNILDVLLRNVIMPVAIAIVLLVMVISLYRSFFSRNGSDVDDPVHVIGWSAFSLAMVLGGYSLLNYFINIAQQVETWVNNVFSGINIGNNSVNAMNGNWSNIVKIWTDDEGGIFSDIADTLGSTMFNITFGQVGEILSCVISIIIFFVLGKRLINFMALYVTRYTQYFLFTLFAPVGFSLFASKRTQDISWRYLRMVFSTLVNLIVTRIMLWLYVYMMFFVLAWNPLQDTGTGGILSSFAERLFFCFVACAFYEFAGRIDEYLMALGITSPIGPNMGPFKTGPGLGPIGNNLLRTGMSRILGGSSNAVGGAGGTTRTGPGGGAKETKVSGGTGMDASRGIGISKSAQDKEKQEQAKKDMSKTFSEGKRSRNEQKNTSGLGEQFARSGRETPRNAAMITPDGKTMSAQSASLSSMDRQKFANGGMKVAQVAEDGRDANPNSPNFEKTLDANAHMVNVGDGKDTERVAWGYMEDGNGHGYQVEYHDAGDGTWKAFARGADGSEAHGTPSDVASQLGATSCGVYGGKPVDVTAETVKAAPGGTVQGAMEQINRTADSPIGAPYMGISIPSVQDGKITAVAGMADGTMRTINADACSRELFEADPDHCMCFDEGAGVYGRVTNVSAGGMANNYECVGGDVHSKIVMDDTNRSHLNQGGKASNA